MLWKTKKKNCFHNFLNSLFFKISHTTLNKLITKSNVSLKISLVQNLENFVYLELLMCHFVYQLVDVFLLVATMILAMSEKLIIINFNNYNYLIY